MKTRSATIIFAIALSLMISSFSNASTNDADNSGNNVVDRRSDAKTPEVQSNAGKDVEVTRAIRRAIVKDDSLSVYAHNIKIITTADHAVFLRGAVSSSDDVDKIVALAKTNAHGYPVTNQLSVSAK